MRSRPDGRRRCRRRLGFHARTVVAAAVLALVAACSLLPPQSGDRSAPATELDLPRIPWEGGPEYWKQFAKADAAGWDEPGFFPIVVWFNGISSDNEAKYDASLGVNTYIGMADTTPYRLFEDNNMYWIGGRLNDTFTASSRNWVGYFLDDEVDGRFPIREGQRQLQERVESTPPGGLFKYANFTQTVIGRDMAPEAAQRYVNAYTDVVSIDMYWYTIPFCDLQPYRGGVYLVPVSRSNCRTASSYGRALNALRHRDAADGRLQPLWQFVENLNGGPGEGPFLAHISAGQLRGAVMNSIINEARGIVYFNQSLSGPCTGGSIFRLSQVTDNYCGSEQVNAAKKVNAHVKELAPVINTQSYDYAFGAGLDTMLKIHEGYAYIFAMVDGDSRPGQRTFRLPTGISGRSVEVLFEDRTLPVDASGRYSDNFAEEYSYHIYRVKL
jgi:hypothetical protein